jgi:uncharacterized protein YbbC (DUF1343 family)
MLKDVDVVLYDIQDVGARVYTYQWTMALSAAAVTAHGRTFIVLDRPNPIRGDRVEGGVLDEQYRSFVGQFPVALRYGLTPGELIRYLVGSGQVNAVVKVVPMAGWRRNMGGNRRPWRNPSRTSVLSTRPALHRDGLRGPTCRSTRYAAPFNWLARDGP